jgi:hypothetical protein
VRLRQPARRLHRLVGRGAHRRREQ